MAGRAVKGVVGPAGREPGEGFWGGISGNFGFVEFWDSGF